MQIPEHWAEARVEGKVAGRPRVVRRFGWSETSAAEAKAVAEQRANEAMADLQAGKKVAPRERKASYGDLGLPIREEVVARNGSIVVTRNAYGARCLNVADVLFADVDVETRLDERTERAFRLANRTIGLLGLLAAALVFWHYGKVFGCSTFLFALLLTWPIHAVRGRLLRRPGVREAATAAARARIEAAIAKDPRARMALYETPNGFRVLALHATFDPRAADARDWLATFGTDLAYSRMCDLQSCFRARVSAKPWRIGTRKHMPPRPGVWPVKPERLPARSAWIAEYESAAAGYAACRHVADVGRGAVHARCADVQRMHDAMAQARTNLPLA